MKRSPIATKSPEMVNNTVVMVRLAGEHPSVWHRGTVIKARKEWVEFDTNDSFLLFRILLGIF